MTLAIQRKRLLFPLYLSLLLPTQTNSFAGPQQGGRSNPTKDTRRSSGGKSTNTRLYNWVEPGEDSSAFDVDTARKQLESLLGEDKDESNIDFSLPKLLEGSTNDLLSSLPPPPPLSSIERDRRLAEIDLLKHLEEGDEPSSKLWNLWYSERGLTAQKKLKAVDKLMGDPTSWHDCEEKLMELIDEYGIYFVEPVNRLATLYYLQGKFKESYRLCQVILKIKPWHFGALAGIVQVCIGMGDRNAARVWAAKRLPNMASGTSFPPFSQEGPVNPRRTEWVEKMVQSAKELMKDAEKNTKKSLGKPEKYYQKPANSNEVLDNNDDSDAWQ